MNSLKADYVELPAKWLVGVRRGNAPARLRAIVRCALDMGLRADRSVKAGHGHIVVAFVDG